MAVWKSENSVYTLVGLEMINLTIGGASRISFTRVVAGSGRVPDSQLMAQTSLSGDTVELELSRYNANENGSEITAYINNSGFTESFTLQQIGIYATSPDFEGEQLIHISQCEEDGADEIPAEGDTPVSFSYSLFLEHSNSIETSIVIDPEGALSLNGGTLIGALGLNRGYGEVDADPYSAFLKSREYFDSDDNSRVLRLYNSKLSDLASSLRIIDYVDGTPTEYKVFGEHNLDLLAQLISGGVVPATIE